MIKAAPRALSSPQDSSAATEGSLAAQCAIRLWTRYDGLGDRNRAVTADMPVIDPRTQKSICPTRSPAYLYLRAHGCDDSPGFLRRSQIVTLGLGWLTWRKRRCFVSVVAVGADAVDLYA